MKRSPQKSARWSTDHLWSSSQDCKLRLCLRFAVCMNFQARVFLGLGSSQSLRGMGCESAMVLFDVAVFYLTGESPKKQHLTSYLVVR